MIVSVFGVNSDISSLVITLVDTLVEILMPSNEAGVPMLVPTSAPVVFLNPIVHGRLCSCSDQVLFDQCMISMFSTLSRYVVTAA